MKKVFSALTVIVALFLVSCMSEIKELSSTNQKGNVALFIGNSSPKLISPAEGLSWRNVSEWTAEFTETNGKYDKIDFYSLDFSKGSYVLKLPVGNFSVKLYGLTSGTTPVKYSGIASVSISEESTESVRLPIFVSTEKTEEGKGSFQFTLGISTDSKESISIVSAILESKSDSLQDVTLTVTPNETDTSKYTLTAESIPSGFYDLSVKCTVGSTTETVGSTTEKEIFKNYSDSVVEIIDGMKTSGSKDITVVTGNTKSYYCTLGESKGNGLWKAYPANIDEVLTIAKDATVKEVNINMTDGIPAIDLAKIGNKVYYIYDKTENLVYTIDGTTEIAGIALSSIDFLTLKDSSGSNLKADITEAFFINTLTLEDNTSIRLTKETTVVFANTEYNSYYAENPFCTASSGDWRVSIGGALTNNYMVTKKTVSETEYNYYVVPSVNSAVSVQSIPTWSIKAEPVMETGADNSYTVFAGDSVTYKASFDEEFTPDSFAWYINGEQYSTTGAEISVTLSDLDTKKYNPGDKNTILCVVSKNGEYSSKAVEITASPHTAETYVLYAIDYSSHNYNIAYTYSNPIEYTSIVGGVADFCTDESGNIYTLSSDGTVTKYEKSSTGFNENSTCSIPRVLTDIATDFSYKYIEVSNGYVFVSGSLYSGNDSKDIYSCIKVSLDSNEATKLGDFTGSVSTFSPYNGGEYIYSIESDSSGATLNKYSTSTGTLTSSVTSILYSTDSASTDETVLKDYVTSANCIYFSLNDMYSTNGYIYVTASETVTSLGSYDALMNPNAVSRGGVIKFSTEDLSVQADDSGAIIYGWDTANVTGTSETDVTNAHTNPNTTFYGAEKIIAVKPDEIVIADDGFEFTGTGAGHLKQKNRVVTFSLTQMAITSVVDDVAYEFDTYFSGSAFNN